MRIAKGVLLLLLILHFPAARAYALDIVAVSPWITVLTHFIGGVKVNVTPLLTWESDRVTRARMRNITNADPNIIALDAAEIKKAGLDSQNVSKVRLLYERAPFDPAQSDKYFGDPSVLPFIAQKLLPVLSSLDPENFSYYQRRLAEFQTRLSSTVLAGRNLLKGQKVLDLTLSYGYFLTAAGCDILRPGASDVEEWARYRSLDSLREIAAASQSENRLVITDMAAPKPVRTVLSSFKNIITLTRPPLDQDFLTFLHSQYLIIWNELKDK